MHSALNRNHSFYRAFTASGIVVNEFNLELKFFLPGREAKVEI